MKFKFSPHGNSQVLKFKFNKHEALYKHYGFEYDENYHPKDDNFDSACDGFKKFLEKKPELQQVLFPPTVEVIPLPSSFLFPLLLTTAQYMFSKIGLQATKGVDIAVTEILLMKIKIAITHIPKYQYCFFASAGLEWQADTTTPYNILRQIEKDTYLQDEEGNIYDYQKVEIEKENYLYFFNFLKPQKIPLPVIRWTGKELIAIHTENIPQFLVEKGIIQIEHKA